MALQSSGAISFADLQAEFGGSHPISLSEYYADADPSLVTVNNSGISSSGSPISVSEFYSKVKALTISLEFIGGGGGGAAYNNPGTPSGTDGTQTAFSAASGVMYNASSGAGLTAFSVGGGAGGSGTNGTTASESGEASYYGPGGTGGTNSDYGGWTDGYAPPATSYGAGGGSAGTNFDHGGPDGGHAGTRVTTTLLAVPSGTITVTIGTGGAGGTGTFRSGGRGADGYAKFTYGNNVTEFTSSGTYTVPS